MHKFKNLASGTRESLAMCLTTYDGKWLIPLDAAPLNLGKQAAISAASISSKSEIGVVEATSGGASGSKNS